MTSIAVIAHQGKSFGGGLDELEQLLAERGFATRSGIASRRASRHLPPPERRSRQGSDLALVWGGDGTAQRCLDVFAGTRVCVGLMPAGTANLLAATSASRPRSRGALDVALGGVERRIDVGVLNGERFGVMAGAGIDALTMKRADGALKDRLGRLAYVWTGTKAARTKAPKATVKVDGRPLV